MLLMVQLAAPAQEADKKPNTKPAVPIPAPAAPAAPAKAATPAVSVAPAAPVKIDTGSGRCYAVLVGGTPGSPMYSARYQDWIKRFKAYLSKTGVPAENIMVLSGDPSFKDAVQIVKGSEDVVKAISKMGEKGSPDDQFILFMVGHGYSMEPDSSFALPVKDLRPTELKQALSGVKSRRPLILNFSTSSGGFLSAIAEKARINVTATNGPESNAPVFAEFFLRGIESGRADGEGASRDGRVTVLEAYNWATCQTALWTVRQTADGEEWAVEGRESCEIFKKLYVFPNDPEGKKMSAKSKTEAPDAVFNLTMITEGAKEEVDASKKFWNGRRGILEHALIEDCGESVGISALSTGEENKKGYAPISPAAPKDTGYLSARTMIGHSKLIDFVKIGK